MRSNREFIFDEVRKIWVMLTPEEWVRQHVLHYLVYTKKYSQALIAVERGIDVNGLQKRFDVAVFGTDGKPKMIIECKAPEEKLDEKVFDQIARYNLKMRVNYLWVSNGYCNFCCKLNNGIELLNAVPSQSEIV